MSSIRQFTEQTTVCCWFRFDLLHLLHCSVAFFLVRVCISHFPSIFIILFWRSPANNWMKMDGKNPKWRRKNNKKKWDRICSYFRFKWFIISCEQWFFSASFIILLLLFRHWPSSYSEVNYARYQAYATFVCFFSLIFSAWPFAWARVQRCVNAIGNFAVIAL